MAQLLCLFFALLIQRVAGRAPSAMLAAFGADPTTSATITFQHNSSSPSYITLSPPLAGASRLAAQAFDNSYANSAGVRIVYRVALEGLAPSTTYTYSATVTGADGGTSAAATFTTLSASPQDVPVVIYWGDLGRDGGGQAFPALEAEAARTAARAPGAGSVGIQAGDVRP